MLFYVPNNSSVFFTFVSGALTGSRLPRPRKPSCTVNQVISQMRGLGIWSDAEPCTVHGGNCQRKGGEACMALHEPWPPITRHPARSYWAQCWALGKVGGKTHTVSSWESCHNSTCSHQYHPEPDPPSWPFILIFPKWQRGGQEKKRRKEESPEPL